MIICVVVKYACVHRIVKHYHAKKPKVNGLCAQLKTIFLNVSDYFNYPEPRSGARDAILICWQLVTELELVMIQSEQVLSLRPGPGHCFWHHFFLSFLLAFVASLPSAGRPISQSIDCHYKVAKIRFMQESRRVYIAEGAKLTKF